MVSMFINLQDTYIQNNMLIKIVSEIIQENTVKEYVKNLKNNKDFERWFRFSVMADGDGNPMIFYHGTNKDFEKFDKNFIGSSTDAGWLGWGFYFYDNISDAREYGKVRAYVLNIENPYYATKSDNKRLSELNDVEASKDFTNDLIEQGYDGVYYNVDLRGETVVFNENQIWEIPL